MYGIKSLESVLFKETISSDAGSGSEGTVAKQHNRLVFFSPPQSFCTFIFHSLSSVFVEFCLQHNLYLSAELV